MQHSLELFFGRRGVHGRALSHISQSTSSFEALTSVARLELLDDGVEKVFALVCGLSDMMMSGRWDAGETE